MIASSCFKASEAFDLQIPALIHGCNQQNKPLIRSLSVSDDAAAERSDGAIIKSPKGTAETCANGRLAASLEGLFETLVLVKGDKTDIHLISITITGIRGMHDYKLRLR